MFRRFVALFLIAGACSAYPHNDETTVRPHPPAESFVDPETGQFDPERGPVDPGSPISLERDPVDPERVHPETLTPEEGHVEGVVEPERGPFPAQNVPVSAEVSEDISAPQDGPKREGDLKTDATSWWPFYRSFWGYPSYTRRSYWTYPYYRYYRPRRDMFRLHRAVIFGLSVVTSAALSSVHHNAVETCYAYCDDNNTSYYRYYYW